MNRLFALIPFAALTLPALAAAANPSISSDAFRAIVGDAANIQRDAEALSRDLKSKTIDQEKVKADIQALGNDIAGLRKDVDQVEGQLASQTPQQQQDWELIKTKVQLLTIFYDRKTELINSGDFKKNRAMLRAHADGIAKRAEMLQATANRLQR